jgi:hypothetical protein
MYGMTPRSMQALIWIIVRGNASWLVGEGMG